MGCPDTPGLEEQTPVDSLLEEDPLSVATTLKQQQCQVNFIKEFFTSRDTIHGSLVDDLRSKFLGEFAHSLLWQNRWEPSKEGTHG